MKLLSIFAFSLLLSCSQPIHHQQSNTVSKTTINKLLNNWHKAAGKADYKNYFSPIDSLGVYIGTDANEIWNKNQFKKFSEPYFKRKKAWDFKPISRNIYFSKDSSVVWFDELLDTWMGVCRGSGILTNHNGFKIKHYVLSITIPNDILQQVIKTKQVADSTQLHNLILNKHK